MKKVKFFKLGAIALTMSSAALNVNAQVGINTESPQVEGLHIIQKDKAANPGHGFILDDGNQHSGYTLTCDANGVGTWRSAGISMLMGVFPTAPTWAQCSGKTEVTTQGVWYATNAYIDLPPGMWRIDMTMVDLPETQVTTSTRNTIQQSTFLSNLSTLNTTFDYTTSTEIGINASSSYRMITGNVYENVFFTVTGGTMVIRNTSAAVKRYFLVVRATLPVTFPYWTAACNAENTIIATPILSVGN